MPNKKQLETIWSEYQSAIGRFLQSKVSDAADVDDLLQDILLKSYHSLHTLKSENSVKSWLFQIASHAIADFYRKRYRAERITADDLWYEQSIDEIKLGLSQCILPFIQVLPEENAILLEQIEIQGISQKEYAKQLGISYSTLKSRVQKSRALLREQFEDCCELTLDYQGSVVDCDIKQGKCSQC